MGMYGGFSSALRFKDNRERGMRDEQRRDRAFDNTIRQQAIQDKRYNDQVARDDMRYEDQKEFKDKSFANTVRRQAIQDERFHDRQQAVIKNKQAIADNKAKELKNKGSAINLKRDKFEHEKQKATRAFIEKKLERGMQTLNKIDEQINKIIISDSYQIERYKNNENQDNPDNTISNRLKQLQEDKARILDGISKIKAQMKNIGNAKGKTKTNIVIGQIENDDGDEYEFIGGNPKDKNNWKKRVDK